MLQKLVLVITAVGSKEVLERWVFDIEQEKDVNEDGTATVEKPAKEITAEISAIIDRSPRRSVPPAPRGGVHVDLLVYTNTESAVPKEWEESDARYIASNAERVKLRSFSTSVHKVEGMVSYKASED